MTSDRCCYRLILPVIELSFNGIIQNVLFCVIQHYVGEI